MSRSKIRFVYMVIAGFIISFILDSITAKINVDRNRFFDFFTSIVITILVWEGNLIIDRITSRYFPWEEKAGKRILVQLPLSMAFGSITIYLSMLGFNKYVCTFPVEARDRFMLTAIILGMLISVIILSVEVGTQFFNNWKNSLVEVEKYKTQSTQAQLQNLKEQVNPHFLFNNLSVLSSLVYKDQDKAVDFINQLSKVYRYLLESRNSELIPLEEELKFIESYTYLLQIRFDTSLKFEIDIPANMRHLLLPPMALQILIENAIKHNEVSSEMPLTISVLASHTELEVKNNLQLRSNKEESSKTGLNNIRERYKFYTDKKVEVFQDSKLFSVKIPLLQKV
ncbi:MAG: histidine kinase [Bacteroidia bacterium]|nr:histidine kinase [Bacteroidia bacterium]